MSMLGFFVQAIVTGKVRSKPNTSRVKLLCRTPGGQRSPISAVLLRSCLQCLVKMR